MLLASTPDRRASPDRKGALPLFAGVLLASMGCQRDPEPAPTPAVPAAAPSTRLDLSGPVAVAAPTGGALSWKAPPGWREQPASAMRKATYAVPPAAGDPEGAELAVFHFGAGQGGTVEANVQRWLGQFSSAEPPGGRRSERTVKGLKVHLVELDRGTYASGMPGGPTTPRPGWALSGAIVVAPGGDWFFKLVGPAATVSSARPAFLELLESIDSKR